VNETEVKAIIARLSDRLRAERVGREISVNRLAEMAGVDRRTIDYIEDPEANPTLGNFLRVVVALELDLVDVVKDPAK